MKRIGLILPSVNVHMEPEFNALGLKDVQFFATRVMLKETTEESLVAMENDLDYAARLIATVYPDVIAYACTSGSFIKGPAWDNKIMNTVTEIAKCPAVTTSYSVLEGIKALGLKKIAMFTPYTDYLNEKETAYFGNKGIEVVAERGLQIIDSEILHSQTEDTIKRNVREIDVPEAQGVFISCTDFKGMGVAQELEDELGKPVLSSNITTLWWLLRQIGYPENIPGYGSLLAKHIVS